MDARVRTGAVAYDQPAGAGSIPPAGSGPSAGVRAGSASTTGAAASARSAGAAKPGAEPGAGTSGSAYSSSFGDVGMSDAGDAGSGSSNGRGGGAHPADAFKDVGARIGELKEFAAYYVAAKIDSYKVTARNLGIYAALGIVGLIAGSAVITTAAVLLLVGLALAIGKPFDPDQPWVGALVVGLLVLGGLAAGIIMFMKKLTATSRKQVVEKYENRQRDQRIFHGEDVRGRRAGSGN